MAGRWQLDLEGIQLVFPLPFIFLHYIPLLGNIRAPGRLAIGFIFFAYIVTAMLLSYFIRKKSLRFKYVFLTLLFIVFIIDHQYVGVKLTQSYKFTRTIYQTIRLDQELVTVLEIPFTVRDGFTYLGDKNAILAVVGQEIHGKAVLGRYMGRLPDYVKNYYEVNPFLGYIARKIDLDKDDRNKSSKLDISASQNTVNFLDVKYIIIKKNKPYTNSIIDDIELLGYRKSIKEDDKILYIREPVKKEFLKIAMNDPWSQLYLGYGWYALEDNFRWMTRRSSVVVKLDKARNMTLNFNAAAFYKPQSMTIYVNKKKVTTIDISINMESYILPIDSHYFIKGINVVYFNLKDAYQPFKVIAGSADQRKLCGKFSEIQLKSK